MKKKTKVVIIAGGEGSRLGIKRTMAKPLVKLKNKPILDWIIEFWKDKNVEFIFVLNQHADMIIRHVKKKKLSNSKFIVESGPPQGIAKALLVVEKYIRGNFIVHLGDCPLKGSFDFPVEDIKNGVGIFKTVSKRMIRRSYSVKISKGRIAKLVEKPKTVTGNLCGMGVYFFTPKIFSAIRSTRPSRRSERVELTDSIQTLVNKKINVSPVFFKGKYININYKEDLRKSF